MKSQHQIINANQAVAHIAYRTNEVFPIYPITPSSEMAELVEEWHATDQTNNFGTLPSVFEMQSEAGVAGAMHGALQTGSLCTTFTASQGLLLMLPNMYKIAGELTPNVIHVATRSIATHALSIFGDHSDIMAVRSSGYAMLGAASVQEAHDFALISQAATLASRVPFVHFFDGFRTSHETSKIEIISDEVISKLIDSNQIDAHRDRALNPNNPVLRGTSQGSDVFFQSREATNSYYNVCPEIVQDKMNEFANLTGRHYQLFDYVGHPNAEQVIITIASSTETVEETIKQLNNKGEKYGLIKVRLFRPFSTKHLVEALPLTCKSIAVLDRTKEPGASGEPLYLDVCQSVFEAYQNNSLAELPKIIGGRYGLSSKEFTPAMVNAVYNNLKSEQSQDNFTVGILDDITHLSLPVDKEFELEAGSFQAVFYTEKPTIEDNEYTSLSHIIGRKKMNYVQSYTELDYKKSQSRQVNHLRIDSKPIKAPYLISNADFIACQNVYFTEKDNVLQQIKLQGTLLVNSSLSSQAFWQSLSANTQEIIIKKEVALYTVDLKNIKSNFNLGSSKISTFDACFLFLNNGFVYSSALAELSTQIVEVDTSIQTNFHPIKTDNNKAFSPMLLDKLFQDNNKTIFVSDLPVDGTFQTNTSQYNPNRCSEMIAQWDSSACIQCGACSMACPLGALRIKVFSGSELEKAPSDFESIVSKEFKEKNFSIQVNSSQCNACNNCVDACDVNALKLVDNTNKTNDNWNYFDALPEWSRTKIDMTKVSQQQLQEPLFKYATGDDGCGESPYLKLLSQLFGDRLLVANATGASSIFGGALPTTPWSKNLQGKGPAWSNSLFEDNAEFGLGFRLSIDQQEAEAKRLLKSMMNTIDFDLVHDIISAKQHSEIEIIQQRKRVKELKAILKTMDLNEAEALLKIADSLIKKSVWCVGGDGWAYDIGFGGLDHVIASGKNVNILILDNEVYSNTGGQMSKSTPFGATAKFGYNGKSKQKKDLGLMAMTYGDVYVASVAIGANQEQTLRAFIEAENYDGPSIIIAYTHSKSHGIDMKNPSQYHKAAVNSGQWLLYRNDPRREENNLNAMQLDSDCPSIRIQDYLKLEGRFSKLFDQDQDQFDHMMRYIQKQVDQRFDRYLILANNKPIHRDQLLQKAKIGQQLVYRK
ncbi:thiamine pyrophosphate-dependent enzyme [Psychroserpens luteolus]|uniref:thiamine pyrophosphate-dependent enzyme n=1 Tax=Psychroserpens luteolus TaxID=2855840 RepID=UPI001E4C3CFE|nr:thiamine pyrophosphate-dependent enzyme [Psychroserpens luteolus]MCD2258321.1 4Fe-4S binding protein [Psychroserpens luteolus]